MYVYKIKVTSSGNERWRESKFEKEFSYSLKTFIKKYKNKGLDLNEEHSKGRTYIVDRYETHRIIDYLLKDGSKDKSKVAGSYYVVNKKVNKVKKYENCSSISSYIVLKTTKKLDSKINEINKEYINITKGKRKKVKYSDKDVKFIKKLENKYEIDNVMIFKQYSPIVIKSTIKQIQESDNKFYKEIYENLNINKESLNEFYINATQRQKLGKNIYFLPDCVKENVKEGAPVITVPNDIYMKMLLKSLNLDMEPNKEYKIIANNGISVIKANKKNEKENNFFNVVGAAITIRTNDEKFIEKASLYGVGHMTNYGFGFVFTEDKDNSGKKNNIETDRNKEKIHYTSGSDSNRNNGFANIWK